jgi:hypothetical protein
MVCFTSEAIARVAHRCAEQALVHPVLCVRFVDAGLGVALRVFKEMICMAADESYDQVPDAIKKCKPLFIKTYEYDAAKSVIKAALAAEGVAEDTQTKFFGVLERLFKMIIVAPWTDGYIEIVQDI